ncbi:MAG: hypothetical protein IPK13_03065 [Deltaproteobacteria bacterium]|nr:hypothetical protein [Deltaproteobacteria bacterium]
MVVGGRHHHRHRPRRRLRAEGDEPSVCSAAGFIPRDRRFVCGLEGRLAGHGVVEPESGDTRSGGRRVRVADHGSRVAVYDGPRADLDDCRRGRAVTISNALLPLILLSSLATGLIIFFVNETSRTLRTTLNLLGATAKLVFVAMLLYGLSYGERYEVSFEIAPSVTFALGADRLSALFVTLSSGLWFVTTLYAVGYLEGAPHRSRFFGFFSVVVTATTGIALAANLVTFLIFYEVLTISTYPLVVHRGTQKAMRAGRTYLAYTVGGGTVLLLAVAWLESIVGPVTFTPGGVLRDFATEHRASLQALFTMFVVALGVKAALFPLHGWLPKAMVAPAPVSALLHAVAVVKAGAFGIVRLVYDVYGVTTARDLGVLVPLAGIAAFTIIYGSIMALFQDELKKRLAYSTISQVSYIVLGIALFGPVATIGGLVHLVHQAIMKITLFFAAGNYAETLGIHRISEMNGVGRRMPGTSVTFTIGSLGMIGLPPLAGYVSKWQLKTGAVLAGQNWIVWVLALSSLLNAAYFLPILYRLWISEGPTVWSKAREVGGRVNGFFETHWMLLVPPVITSIVVVAAGVFANVPFGPLAWVRLLVAEEYASRGMWTNLASAKGPLDLSLRDVVSSTWPAFLGGALAVVGAKFMARRAGNPTPRPELEADGAKRPDPPRDESRGNVTMGARLEVTVRQMTGRIESKLQRLDVAGTLLLLIIGVLFFLNRS